MKFHERWWEESTVVSRQTLEKLSFLFTPERDIRVWWTTRKEASTLLTGWVGGPQSFKVSSMSGSELGRLAVEILAEVFGVNEDIVRGSTRRGLYP
jgi:hypothetical protein